MILEILERVHLMNFEQAVDLLLVFITFHRQQALEVVSPLLKHYLQRIRLIQVIPNDNTALR